MLETFRSQHGGTGRVEPWTVKEPVGTDGNWVVREYLDVSVRPIQTAKSIAEGSQQPVYVVSYWSRIVDASAWRGPDLPTFWDRHADGYLISGRGAQQSVVPADQPSPK